MDGNVAVSPETGSSEANQPAANDSAPTAVTKELRYHAQIGRFTDCPPVTVGHHSVGYRFCFKDLADTRNFLPNAVLDLTRADGRAPPPCCSSFGLSMFVDLDALIAKGLKIQKTNRKFFEKKGDHFAKLALGPDVGRCTEATEAGHFDFFEYTCFTAASAVLEHGKLNV